MTDKLSNYGSRFRKQMSGESFYFTFPIQQIRIKSEILSDLINLHTSVPSKNSLYFEASGIPGHIVLSTPIFFQ